MIQCSSVPGWVVVVHNETKQICCLNATTAIALHLLPILPSSHHQLLSYIPIQFENNFFHFWYLLLLLRFICFSNAVCSQYLCKNTQKKTERKKLKNKRMKAKRSKREEVIVIICEHWTVNTSTYKMWACVYGKWYIESCLYYVDRWLLLFLFANKKSITFLFFLYKKKRIFR